MDGGHKFSSLTAGWNHTCGLDTSGRAWCWGEDIYGQLGDASTTQTAKLSPVAVVGGHVFTSLTAGGAHTCGVDTSGRAWCWGYDIFDALATTTSRPVAVGSGHVFARLTAGLYHTCGLDTSGQAWCWGFNGNGRLGDGDTTGADKFTPVAVVGGHTFTSLDAGQNHTCGVDTSKVAWCWGYGGHGQLGDGDSTTTLKFHPVAVVGGSPYTSVSAGELHTCATDTWGQSWCWGDDTYGQLGDGDTTGTNKFRPVAVIGGSPYTSVTAGGIHTCAVSLSGRAWCWGDDRYGELGDGDPTQTNKFSPVPVV